MHLEPVIVYVIIGGFIFTLGMISVISSRMRSKNMAKTIQVEIPRSTIQELNGDTAFASRLFDAILEAETTGKVIEVSIGKARKKAHVFITEG